MNAKLIIVLRRPVPTLWKTDYDTAINRLKTLEKEVAQGAAPIQYLLDRTHDPPFIRFSFPLWEKKVRMKNLTIYTLYNGFHPKKYSKNSQKYADDELEPEDDIMRDLRTDHSRRGIHHLPTTSHPSPPDTS